MAISLRDILGRLEALYPSFWAAPGDRVGLQIGHPDQAVNLILVALEVSGAVLAEARNLGAQLLLTHHPCLYQPLEQVREDRAPGRLIAGLIRAGIAVASCHTNLDAAPEGLNDYLARLLELEGVEVLSETGWEPWCKLAVFVPVGYEGPVRQALFDERVGVIGRYAHCSFAVRGQGTYLPMEGASPWRGEIRSLARADESRLEVLVPESQVEAAVQRLKAAHPYEEVAYEVYPLKNPGQPRGFGRLGRWHQPRPWPEVAACLKESFQIKRLKVWGHPPGLIQRVAVCGGSGGDLAVTARQRGAHLYVTGEVRHHQIAPLDPGEFAVAEVGHFASEVVFMPEWARRLQDFFHAAGLNVTVKAAQQEEPPFEYA